MYFVKRFMAKWWFIQVTFPLGPLAIRLTFVAIRLTPLNLVCWKKCIHYTKGQASPQVLNLYKFEVLLFNCIRANLYCNSTTSQRQIFYFLLSLRVFYSIVTGSAWPLIHTIMNFADYTTIIGVITELVCKKEVHAATFWCKEKSLTAMPEKQWS